MTTQFPSSPFRESRRSKNPTWPISPNRYDCLEFNLSTGNYKHLITQIRNLLQQPGRYSHNLPILPIRRHVEPQTWLDLVLSTGHHTITLRIRQENLYLDGFQMENSRWLEFDNVGSTHIIPGSSFLTFTGSYPDLERVGGMPLTDLQISRAQVLNAVDELALINDERWRARHLSLLILVVCEATRFEDLSRRFVGVMKSGSTITERIEEWTLVLIRAWGDLSGRLLRAEASGDQYFCLPSNSHRALRSRIRTAFEAASYVGLLLGPLGTYVPAGQPMMEVFSVQILDFSSWEVSITITVTDGLGTQVLDFGIPKCVRPRDTFYLKRLERAISAWESIEISYDVTLRDREMNFTGSDSWDIFQINNNNKTYSPTQVVLRRCYVGNSKRYSYQYGGSNQEELLEISLAMNYEIHPSAWQVNWEAKVISAGGYNYLNVYGYFKIKYWIRGKYYEVMLFLRSWEDNAKVYVGGCLPLSRNVTALPLDVEVMVEGDLKDRINSFVIWDREVFKGNVTHRFGGVEFGNKETGRFLFMQNGLIQITAKWSRLSQC